MTDAQRLVLEESPQTLDGNAQPKRLSVFLRDDLVEPKMEKEQLPVAAFAFQALCAKFQYLTSSAA